MQLIDSVLCPSGSQTLALDISILSVKCISVQRALVRQFYLLPVLAVTRTWKPYNYTCHKKSFLLIVNVSLTGQLSKFIHGLFPVVK